MAPQNTRPSAVFSPQDIPTVDVNWARVWNESEQDKTFVEEFINDQLLIMMNLLMLMNEVDNSDHVTLN